MTSKEAKQQVDACERRIVSEYNKMCSAARDVGKSAYHAADTKVVLNTFLPLIISALGILVRFSHPGWGVVLIVLGVIVALCSHSSARQDRDKVEKHQRNLNSEIDRIPYI